VAPDLPSPLPWRMDIGCRGRSPAADPVVDEGSAAPSRSIGSRGRWPVTRQVSRACSRGGSGPLLRGNEGVAKRLVPGARRSRLPARALRPGIARSPLRDCAASTAVGVRANGRDEGEVRAASPFFVAIWLYGNEKSAKNVCRRLGSADSSRIAVEICPGRSVRGRRSPAPFAPALRPPTWTIPITPSAAAQNGRIGRSRCRRVVPGTIVVQDHRPGFLRHPHICRDPEAPVALVPGGPLVDRTLRPYPPDQSCLQRMPLRVFHGTTRRLGRPRTTHAPAVP
jgi:hypothetical protein